MEDHYSVVDHLNSFNTMESQLVYVDIKMGGKGKCITLLCSFPNSWGNLVVEIGSSTQTTIKFEYLVASLLSKGKRIKSMEGVTRMFYL